MGRICRECAAPLAGRSDKKFCCDDCRTAYHNRHYRMERLQAAHVNRILMVNRRLLAALHASGQRTVNLADTTASGFDCRYYTAAERRPLHRVRYHCYEFSYEICSGRICRLVKEGDRAVT